MAPRQSFWCDGAEEPSLKSGERHADSWVPEDYFEGKSTVFENVFTNIVVWPQTQSALKNSDKARPSLKKPISIMHDSKDLIPVSEVGEGMCLFLVLCMYVTVMLF